MEIFRKKCSVFSLALRASARQRIVQSRLADISNVNEFLASTCFCSLSYLSSRWLSFGQSSVDSARLTEFQVESGKQVIIHGEFRRDLQCSGFEKDISRLSAEWHSFFSSGTMEPCPSTVSDAEDAPNYYECESLIIFLRLHFPPKRSTKARKLKAEHSIPLGAGMIFRIYRTFRVFSAAKDVQKVCKHKSAEQTTRNAERYFPSWISIVSSAARVLVLCTFMP